MAMKEEDIVLVFFAFMVVFLTFQLRRAGISLTLDLLKCNVRA